MLFHLVELSAWPLSVGLTLSGLTAGIVIYMKYFSINYILLCLMSLLVTVTLWWRDCIREGTQGYHNKLVVTGLKYGFFLFIVSELMLFSAFFWAYFHSGLSPTLELGGQWPPQGVPVLDMMGLPLMNTIILLSSACSVTWAHFSLENNKLSASILSLTLTVILGIFFLFAQGGEYLELAFSISDSVYGSCFFSLTGLHGFHVLVGTMFLFVCLLKLQHYSSHHYTGFLFAIWYWHFVDVVWLGLFISVYCWGS